MRRRELLGLAAALAGAGVMTRVLPARAQSLAGKQIRVLVPFPPGGPTDIVARPFAKMLGDALNATIIVDNRSGAGGSIGADLIAKSPPDGQAILIGTVGTNAINPALYASLPYDPLSDFTPLALIAQAPVAIVVHPLVEARTLADLVALARNNPGQLSYGTAGPGTPGHLTAEMFRRVAGIDMQHVPYRGSAPALTDLIGGQIPIMFDPLQSVLSNVQAGKIRALALSSKTRAPVVPDVPTIAESGYADFETTAWWGVFAPAKLPDDLTASLVAESERITASDAFRQKLEPLGVTAVTGVAGAAFADFQKNEVEKWGKVVKDANVKID
ncbi:MAG: tripartite tricarboxylate transporter substrate binding protein [Bradyrhizobium sp.]|nr:tripartite tricarboxylate transporter substrate binding protein [Bradyrhizobium sp.]